MYEVLIKEYLKKLSLNDINDFDTKNNMPLASGEDKIIYELIMNNWKDVYKGNSTNVFSTLKEKVSENTYNNVISLYNKYKGMIK